MSYFLASIQHGKETLYKTDAPVELAHMWSSVCGIKLKMYAEKAWIDKVEFDVMNEYAETRIIRYSQMLTEIGRIRPESPSSTFRPLIIAVDFDGTIVRNKWPDIGEPIPDAAETIRLWHAQGHRVVIWTCRAGKELEACEKWLIRNWVPFYSINSNPSDRISLYGSDTRKISADLYIDDKAVGAPDDPAQLWKMAREKVAKMEREEAYTCTFQPKANF